MFVHTRRQRTIACGVMTVGLFLLLAALSIAADLTGTKDHPLLKRFAGSEIVGYDVKRFDAYELQTSTFVRFNSSAKKREYKKSPLQIEGGLTRIWYEAAGAASATELMRNYQNELQAQKFQILYDSAKDPAAASWTNFLASFAEMKITTSRSPYVFYAANKSTIRVLSAILERPEGDVYVSLTAVEWTQDRPVYKARRGAYMAVDIVETRPMVQNMVLIKADEMSRTIAATGRIALYGIYFDSNKADIKNESKPILQEIAMLLKKEPGLKLHVVGHTDNVGGLEFNLGLSRRRADAVVEALTKEFGVPAGCLTANGVAYLAPVAANTSEAGRARNRRVELVPR